jgi:hypothetical protein
LSLLRRRSTLRRSTTRSSRDGPASRFHGERPRSARISDRVWRDQPCNPNGCEGHLAPCRFATQCCHPLVRVHEQNCVAPARLCAVRVGALLCLGSRARGALYVLASLRSSSGSRPKKSASYFRSLLRRAKHSHNTVKQRPLAPAWSRRRVKSQKTLARHTWWVGLHGAGWRAHRLVEAGGARPALPRWCRM